MLSLNLITALEKLAGTGISWESGLCSRMRFPRSRCEDCLAGCPERALSWDKTLKLAEEKCTGCGLCIACCPNGAFWDRDGDMALIREIGYFLPEQSEVFRFACLRCAVTDVPTLFLCCLGRLSESIVLASFLNGARKVEICRPDCSGCKYERSLSNLERTIRLSKGLASMMGLEGDSLVEREVGLRGGPLSETPHYPTLRRDFLRQASQAALRTVFTILSPSSNSHEGRPWAHLVSPKRALLLHLIQGVTPRLSVSVKAKGLHLAEIKINRNCIGCPVCSTLCPTGALERVERERDVFLYFRPWLCTGCLICQEACLFLAVSPSAEFPLEKLVGRDTQLLCKLTTRICLACGDSFWGEENNRCPRCRVGQLRDELPRPI